VNWYKTSSLKNRILKSKLQIKFKNWNAGGGERWGADWIDLAQDRDKWRSLVNAWWTFGLHKTWGISWLAEQLLASQEEVCSLELVSSNWRLTAVCVHRT